ncbi:MAG: hypothetical protein KJ941_02765 [Bacteroidetes bacterium]|nr:hypothetical protein [Bacteroidota bacterium]
MNQELNDLKQIRNMMERNSRFISLSGMSGVFAGICALVGAYTANGIIKNFHSEHIYSVEYYHAFLLKLSALALVVLISALLGALFFTYKKTKKQGTKMWTPVSKRILVNMGIPLLAGGVFSIALLVNGSIMFVAPTLLIFYGIACIHSSTQTLEEVFFLGLTLLILGLISLFFLGHGLIFWTIGFGLCHVLYGAWMYFKYDRVK